MSTSWFFSCSSLVSLLLYILIAYIVPVEWAFLKNPISKLLESLDKLEDPLPVYNTLLK